MWNTLTIVQCPTCWPSRNLWNPGGGFDWISAFSGAVGLVIVSSCFYIQFICTLFLTHFEGFPLNWRWEKWLEFARSRAESHSIPVAYESKILLDWSQSGRPPIKGHLYRKNSLQICLFCLPWRALLRHVQCMSFICSNSNTALIKVIYDGNVFLLLRNRLPMYKGKLYEHCSHEMIFFE